MGSIKPDKDNCPECGTLTDRNVGEFVFDPNTGDAIPTFDCHKCGKTWVYDASKQKPVHLLNEKEEKR